MINLHIHRLLVFQFNKLYFKVERCRIISYQDLSLQSKKSLLLYIIGYIFLEKINGDNKLNKKSEKIKRKREKN